MMAKTSEHKTNVMRILEQRKISYTAHSYAHEEGVPVDGVTVAERMGQDPGQVFKTLVARGASKAYYVFDVPVAKSLDLKKAARAVGEKSIEMIPVREITALTGYVRGGCSPIGMKKQFPTVLDATALAYETIVVSGGKIGKQVELSPRDLLHLVRGTAADITTDA